MTDAGMAHLSGLKKLRILGLQDTQVSDAGLASFKDCSLEEIYFFRTRIGDEGLAHLKGMSKMRIVVMRDTLITDDGLACLKGMPDLIQLDVSEVPGITDAGMAHLVGLKNLKDLNLWFTGVGDAGIEQLTGLTNIKRLNETASLLKTTEKSLLKKL